MNGTLPVSVWASAMLNINNICPFGTMQRLGALQSLKPDTRLHARRWLNLAINQGHLRLKVVWACWHELFEEGCGIGQARPILLAFTGSLCIAKFFSNLQLLDVWANHQRGLRHANPPFQTPTNTTLHLLTLWSAVLSRPVHLFMCLFIISSAASELKRGCV